MVADRRCTNWSEFPRDQLPCHARAAASTPPPAWHNQPWSTPLRSAHRTAGSRDRPAYDRTESRTEAADQWCGRTAPTTAQSSRSVSSRRIFNQLNRGLENVLLLHPGQSGRGFVRIAVGPDFVAGRHDHLGLFGKGLDRMTGYEKGRFDVELVEQLENPRRADLAREDAALDVVQRVRAAPRTEEAGNG